MSHFKTLLVVVSTCGVIVGVTIGALTDQRRAAAAAESTAATIITPANLFDEHNGPAFGGATGGSRSGGH